jgi:DeoR/GlpR family transcriptional regulator of sugar metabolism
MSPDIGQMKVLKEYEILVIVGLLCKSTNSEVILTALELPLNSNAMPVRRGKSPRQSQILEELRAAPSLRVADLATRLAVSSETIRRDLAELDARRLINRVHGGAVRQEMVEPALAERLNLMEEERQAIARRAAELISDNDIVMIGGGATTLHVARQLAAQRLSLTVITHSFTIAQALAVNPQTTIIMLPGQYDPREGVIIGGETVEALQRYRASHAILGASGLTAEGPNDAGLTAGRVYSAMMQRAAETLIVADHSKFERHSLVVIGPWSAKMTLVTDRAPGPGLASALDMAGAGCVFAA